MHVVRDMKPKKVVYVMMDQTSNGVPDGAHSSKRTALRVAKDWDKEDPRAAPHVVCKYVLVEVLKRK